MSAWNDTDRWAALCSGAACPICHRGEPLDIVAGLEASWVTAQEAAPMRGYVCLVSRIHAVDLHDLPATAAAAFMRDAQLTSQVLSSITGAVE
jgi:diadenosine tetraphosphate (Ap4A) HIT family hydrolase